MTTFLFSRTDTTPLGRWFWTIDRWSLVALMTIMAMGTILSFSASPAVALHLKLGTFYFVKRHAMILPLGFVCLIWVSFLNLTTLRRLASVMYVGGIILLILTLFCGADIKGARRWIMLGGTSFQASEMIKPALAILGAWMLSEIHKDDNFPGVGISFSLFAIVGVLLMMQPDLGMTVVTGMTWLCQLFIAGLPLFWVFIGIGASCAGLLGAYMFFPHVTKRIDQFFAIDSDLYQVNKSLEAFMHGGLFGKGPGEGIIKRHVPDAHADFVFSVAGEEFGFLVCLLIVFLFVSIIVRSMIRAHHSHSLFIMLATVGLTMQLGMQAFVNMASSLHLIPTKGMTLPFMSYGGSSFIALAIAMGMLFALTRKRHGMDII